MNKERLTVTSPVVASLREDDDTSDDDTGPMLPSSDMQLTHRVPQDGNLKDLESQRTKPEAQGATAPHKRPEWMLNPPTATDWTKSIDTTNLKSRTFAQHRPGKASSNRPASDSAHSSWTKIDGSSRSESDTGTASKSNDVLESKHNSKQRRIAAEHHQERGESLFQQHNDKRRRTGNVEDDVTKRPFDREKDIGGNNSLVKTRHLANQAKNLGSMFETSKYL